jgi:hypothetical protein
MPASGWPLRAEPWQFVWFVSSEHICVHRSALVLLIDLELEIFAKSNSHLFLAADRFLTPLCSRTFVHWLH